jgi:hypothetical protein
MRLTLRTLLAWLDDTLSPAEVREIGKQVGESPVAKELKDRIQRVTRQRRLTVPPSNGPDGADPNLVAAYLDNELDPERVNEFEKKCLTSDVHLAEVASVHQILSLIGQKAKVPAEARNRMYQLIKGREAVAPRARRSGEAPRRAPVTEPIQPWVAPEAPVRPWYERYLPALAAALLVVLCVSAWMSLSPPETRNRDLPAVPVVASNEPQPQAKLPDNAAAGNASGAAAAKGEPSVAANNEPDPKAEDAKGEPDSKALARAESTAAAPKKDAAAPSFDLPAGALAMITRSDGVVLRYTSDLELGPWQQVAVKTPIKSQERVLSLAPFRSTLQFGKARIDLIGETEVLVKSALSNVAVRFNLVRGKVVLHGDDPTLPFEVQFGGRSILVTAPSATPVGLERVNRRTRGSARPDSSALRIFVPDGEVTLGTDNVKEMLDGPGSIVFEPPGRWTGKAKGEVPSWVTEEAPSPFESQIGGQFLRLIDRKRPINAELVGALDSDQRDVRRLAITGLKAIGEISEVIALLGRPEDSVARRATISVLRAYMSEGAEESTNLRKGLVDWAGAENAPRIEKLLVGFTTTEAKEEATFRALVADLSASDVAVRELAIDNLESLTGRDDLGYDAEKPQGPGLKAWNDLLKRNELRAAAAPAPAAPGAADDTKPPPPPARPPAKDSGASSKGASGGEKAKEKAAAKKKS